MFLYLILIEIYHYHITVFSTLSDDILKITVSIFTYYGGYLYFHFWHCIMG